MSQMTVTQMSITETTDSPQHKLHWLAEQALSWSGCRVTMRRRVPRGFFQCSPRWCATASARAAARRRPHRAISR